MNGQDSRLSNIEHWSNDALDRVQRELAGAETPLYLMADDILRVLEEAEAVPSTTTQGAVAKARADQREATIRHAAEFLDTLGRADLARALTNALHGGQ